MAIMVNTIYDQVTQYNSKQFKVLANRRMMYYYYWNHHSHILFHKLFQTVQRLLFQELSATLFHNTFQTTTGG